MGATLSTPPTRRSTMAGQEQAAQVDDGLDVGPDHAQLGLRVAAVDGTGGGQAGVVDEDPDLSPRSATSVAMAVRAASSVRSAVTTSADAVGGGELGRQLLSRSRRRATSVTPCPAASSVASSAPIPDDAP